MWIVLVFKPGVVVPVTIGPFREEAAADGWAERIRDGYDFDAIVEWVYSPSFREPLREALADLIEQEPKVFSVD